jgi:gamma-glutamyltranspeptidase/glutathione hydrolase
VRAKAVAAATDPDAAASAEELLAAKGSAADAVLAAYFRWAGALGNALFSPAVALVAGAGAGARAFDGRALQPGAGAQRPRGVPAGETPPPEARAAVPRAPHMALLLHAAHGRRPLREVIRPGVEAAKKAGADRRALLLGQIGEGAMQTLRRDELSRAVMRVAGTNVGGQLTEQDLAQATPADEPARADADGDARVLRCPWPSVESGPTELAVCAVDSWGLVAALAVAPSEEVEALVVSEIEVQLPAVAEPVLRGKSRAQPRSVLPIGARIAVLDAGTQRRIALALGRDATATFGALAESLGPARTDEALAGAGARIAAIAEGGSVRAWKAP